MAIARGKIEYFAVKIDDDYCISLQGAENKDRIINIKHSKEDIKKILLSRSLYNLNEIYGKKFNCTAYEIDDSYNRIKCRKCEHIDYRKKEYFREYYNSNFYENICSKCHTKIKRPFDKKLNTK